MKLLVSSLLIANIFCTPWSLKAKGEGTLPATTKGDTVIVRLKNRNQVVVMTERDRDLRSLRNIDLNRIIADIDSLFRSDSAGSQVEIRTNGVDSVLRVYKQKAQPQRRSYKTILLVGEPEVSGSAECKPGSGNEGVNISFGKRNDPDDDIFEIDLGWNNYLENGGLPSDAGKPYGLRPFNSNIVNLRYMKTILGRKPGNRTFLTAGLEVSWHNYKFERDVVIKSLPAGVAFEPVSAEKNLNKSKLTISWLNVPLMVNYKARRSSFHMAAGGFAGYRLSSHSKIRYTEEGSSRKDKDFENFSLNSLQYGLRLQFGFYDVDFFASYNLNELFRNGRGPALTPFSFGFTL